MNKYIDMHCHILPAVDDGARNLEETVKMLKVAYKDGIRHIVATPHYHPQRGTATQDEIKEQLRIVRQEAKKLDERFKVFVANEIYFGQDIPELLQQKQILSINGKDHVLVEFSPSSDPIYIKQGISQLQMQGYKVIVAHVERYTCLRADFSLVEYLFHTGVLLQVNAGSILGDYGRDAKKFVKELLEKEMIFCVGTDAHDYKKRPPQMSKAAHYVAKKYGEEYARRIFFNNIAGVLRKQR